MTGRFQEVIPAATADLLSEPVDEEIPVFCSAHGEGGAVTLFEMRHAERLEKQRVAIVGEQHRFIVAAAVAHPIEGEVEPIGAESAVNLSTVCSLVQSCRSGGFYGAAEHSGVR